MLLSSAPKTNVLAGVVQLGDFLLIKAFSTSAFEPTV